MTARVKSYWVERAQNAIASVHKALPIDTPLPERIKAVDVAYCFGERAHWPYKMWLKARAGYLRQFGWTPKNSKQIPLPLSPLERAKRKAEAAP